MRGKPAVVSVAAAVWGFAQTTPADARFAVASVKMLPAAPRGAGPGQSVTVNPGSFIAHGASLRSIVTWAYDVRIYQISCPSWMGTPGTHGEFPRYEISAKASDAAPVAQMKLMMRNLLADRFHLALHRETKETQVLEVILVKRQPELQESGNAAADGAVSQKGMSYAWRRTSMPEFCEFLSQPFGVPVVDKTGLSGNFDFGVDLARGGTGPSALDWMDAFQRAMLAQLGLKLERGKAPIEMLVVDRADMTPSEN